MKNSRFHSKRGGIMKRRYIDFYKGNSASNVSRPFRDVIYAVRSREAVGIVAHDAVYILLKRELFDEDRRLIMCPRRDRKL